MTPRTLRAAVVLSAVVVVAGCAAETAPVVRSQTPSPSPIDAPFAGDCGSVLTDTAVEVLVGGTAEAEASIDGSELVCTWQGSARSLTVTAMASTDAAPAEIARLTLPECDPATGFCGGGIEAGGLWIVVDFGFVEGEWEPVVSTALKAVANAAEAHG